MTEREHAGIFVDIPAHIESGRFIRDVSTNKEDIRQFTFRDVDLRGCRDILDLGCSYGYFTRGLAGRLHHDARVTGMDLWPGCEDYFLRACQDSGFSGRFLVSDNELCQRFAAESFDLVLCSYALYFFPHAIADIARILRPGGLFITVTHSVPHMHELVDIVKKVLLRSCGQSFPFLPVENLFDSFSDVNGYRMLSPWFREIREKKYVNALRINGDDLPRLIKYLCFKMPKFIPGESGFDERFLCSEFSGYLRQILDKEGALTISKNDMVYICHSPRAGE